MNRKLGMLASIVTLLAVLGFAISMLAGLDNGNYLSSIFIALGFVSMVCAFASYSEKDLKAASYTAMLFSAIYGIIVSIVYFAQLTTVQMTDLSEEADLLLNYNKFNLIFNYDLLGYSFMALATFFTGLALKAKCSRDKWLKGLLMIHGIFAACFILPLLGIFKAGMEGGDLIGNIVLEFWCAYFTPLCILSYIYFKKQEREMNSADIT
ncbi:MAG: hypothetical protein ABFD25_22375 [Clostridiaceae bacterium]